MMQTKIKLIYQIIVVLNFIRLLMIIRRLIFNVVYPEWKNYYQVVNNRNLLSSKKSDTIFIFGSGYSINDISEKEFRYFTTKDTLSFNWFVYQNFLPVKYHLIRELVGDEKNLKDLNEKIETFKDLINKKNYKDSIFLLQNDLTATMPFELLNRFIFPFSQKIFFFKTSSRNLKSFPDKLEKGLVHSAGTLTDCVSFAYLMGYKKIVLVGVDLYDRRYFWLKEDESLHSDTLRNNSFLNPHNTASPMLHVLQKWNEKFKGEGVQMYTYNEKSLLNEFLPIYKLPKEY